MTLSATSGRATFFAALVWQSWFPILPTSRTATEYSKYASACRVNIFMETNPRLTVAASSLSGLWRFLASLKLAVGLMVMLAVVLAAATVMESQHGMAYAHWYVYKSRWFCGLLGLLGVNIFSAAAVRFPWKRHQTGFVITHAGLLVLLIGSVQSFLGGIEGRVWLTEGETASHVIVPECSQVTATWSSRPDEVPYEFLFDGGPVEWPADRVLNLGTVDGIGARVLKFYRHANPVTEWVADDRGGPLLKFRLIGPGGKTVTEGLLADEQFGDAVSMGPIRIQLQRAINHRMEESFRSANVADTPRDGVVFAYYQDAAEQIPVAEQMGQKTPMGKTGAAIEVVEYLPNAHPDEQGRFVSKGEEPRNPMVELRVYLPGTSQPIRQIAFANDPLLNLDRVYSEPCPVKFSYRHPAVKAGTAVEFLQGSDGTLYARITSDGHVAQRGSVCVGDNIQISPNFELNVLQYLPHARPEVRFEPVTATAIEKNPPEAAALIELTVGGEKAPGVAAAE